MKNTRTPRPPLEMLERRPATAPGELDTQSTLALLRSMTPEQRKQAVQRNARLRTLVRRNSTLANELR